MGICLPYGIIPAKYTENLPLKNVGPRQNTHSKSPACAQILFLLKQDDRLRLCVDDRQLNKLTILNKYALLLISKLGDRVAVVTIFTKVDLKDSYDLIRIKKTEEWKTAFRTLYRQ